MSAAQTWVTFAFNGARCAVPADAVTAIIDQPALGPLPQPLGAVTTMLAHGGELCAVVTGTEADPATPVVVCLNPAGNVALHVGEPVRIESGTRHDERADVESGAARVLSLHALVAQAIRWQSQEGDT